MTPDFIRLASESVRGEPLSPESQAFVRAAVVAWLAGEGMESAFGIAAGLQGQRSAHNRMALALRDGRLRDAALQLGLPSRRAAAREIARRWARLADGKDPADPVDNFLLPAVRLSGSLSEASIRRAIA